MSKYINLLSTIFKIRSFKYLFMRGCELLMGYPIWIISFFIPRNKNKWVFGTNVGFADNAKYLFIYTNEQNDEILPIWISPQKEDAKFIKDLGFKAYWKYSLFGLYHSLTAGIYIFTYYSKNINFFTSGNAKKVNLWHGIGIKGNGNVFRRNSQLLTKFITPYIFEKFALFLSTSPMMSEHFKNIFMLDDEIVFESVYPRCYYMCKDKIYFKEFIHKYEAKEVIEIIECMESFSKVYLYMPTWRNTLNDDFIKDAGFNFNRLNKDLKEQNALFIFKLHPAVRILENESNDFDNIIFLDKQMDIYPFLNFIDVLITDYSSIYYDYLLLNKEVLLYPFDRKDYIDNQSNLVFDYDQYTPGVKVYNIDELMRIISSEEKLNIENRQTIIDLFWKKSNINDLSLLYNKIKSL